MALGLLLALSGCGDGTQDATDDTASDPSPLATETEAEAEPEPEPEEPEPTEGPESEEVTEDDEDLYAQVRELLPSRIVDAGRIVVSNPLQNPPYAFMLEDGETLQGIAPDLSRALEPILGVEFEWVDTPFPGLIPGLQAETFDMIWGSITDTEEREEILDFVTYHMDGAHFLVAAGNPTDIGSIEDVCGQAIAALEGSVQIEMLETQSEACVENGEEPVNIRIYPSVPDGQLAVRSGQSAAFFAGLGAGRYQATVASDVFETAGPVYGAAPFGAGFRKGDELAEAIQAGLKLLVEDGTYLSILGDYGMEVVALDADEIIINGAAELRQDELILDQ